MSASREKLNAQEKFRAQAKNKRLNSFDGQRQSEREVSIPKTPKSRLSKAGENLKVQINVKRSSGEMASPGIRTPSETQHQKKPHSIPAVTTDGKERVKLSPEPP